MPTTGRHQEVEWDGQKLMLGFPSHKMTNPVTSVILAALAMDIGKEKVRIEPQFGDAIINNARNKIAEAFLESECEWLLFLDDDMVPVIGRPGFIRKHCRLPDGYREDALNLHFAHRLTSHKAKTKLVGATYFERRIGGLPVNGLRGDSTYITAAMGFYNEIMPTPWVGTGCLLIHRDVFESIRPLFPQLEPTVQGEPYRFFASGEDGAGEDIAFCRRALRAGHHPHVDCGLHALHVGYMAYGAHTSAYSGVAKAFAGWR